MIGGIFTEDESEDVAKVPLLGDIPIVGNLFKNKNKASRKQELLIFITPRSINEGSLGSPLIVIVKVFRSDECLKAYREFGLIVGATAASACFGVLWWWWGHSRCESPAYGVSPG